jgi:hypothetical protein
MQIAQHLEGAGAALFNLLDAEWLVGRARGPLWVGFCRSASGHDMPSPDIRFTSAAERRVATPREQNLSFPLLDKLTYFLFLTA